MTVLTVRSCWSPPGFKISSSKPAGPSGSTPSASRGGRPWASDTPKSVTVVLTSPPLAMFCSSVSPRGSSDAVSPATDPRSGIVVTSVRTP